MTQFTIGISHISSDISQIILDKQCKTTFINTDNSSFSTIHDIPTCILSSDNSFRTCTIVSTTSTIWFFCWTKKRSIDSCFSSTFFDLVHNTCRWSYRSCPHHNIIFIDINLHHTMSRIKKFNCCCCSQEKKAHNKCWNNCIIPSTRHRKKIIKTEIWI